jgi:hypothetical protein
MITLNETERSNIQVLEARVARLAEKLASASMKNHGWLIKERNALVWVMEVLSHAQATNCEEAFAYCSTRLETGKRELIERYVQDCVAREKVRQEKKAARLAEQAAKKWHAAEAQAGPGANLDHPARSGRPCAHLAQASESCSGNDSTLRHECLPDSHSIR